MTMLKTVFIAAFFIANNPILAMDDNVPTGTLADPLEMIRRFIADPEKFRYGPPPIGFRPPPILIDAIITTTDFKMFQVAFVRIMSIPRTYTDNPRAEDHTPITNPYKISLKQLQSFAQIPCNQRRPFQIYMPECSQRNNVVAALKDMDIKQTKRTCICEHRDYISDPLAHTYNFKDCLSDVTVITHSQSYQGHQSVNIDHIYVNVKELQCFANPQDSSCCSIC